MKLTIRIGAYDAQVRAELRAEVEGALLGEERDAAEITTTHVVDRPKGTLEPDVSRADVRQAGAFILIAGVPGSGKSTLASRVSDRLRRIQRGRTVVVTRVAS